MTLWSGPANDSVLNVMAKASFHELLGISDKASPEEIQAAFERARTALGEHSDSEECRNRLVFLQHARDSLLDGRKRALRDRDNKRYPSPSVPASRSSVGWYLVCVVAVMSGYALAWWTAKPVAAPVSSAVAAHSEPQALSATSVPLSKLDDTTGRVANATGPSIEPRPAASANPQNRTNAALARLRELSLRSDTMFDMKAEIYRIANIGGVRLQDIQFDGDEKKSASVAWAMPTLDRKERYCSIRVARAYGQDRLLSGAPVTAFESTRYKAILAHELSHCLDWYETGYLGWRIYGSGISRPLDLSPADVSGRWGEEFADLYAIHLLNLAYGQEVAKDAAQILALERRRSSHPSYKHSWVPMERGNPLSINSPADAHTIIARYWMQ